MGARQAYTGDERKYIKAIDDYTSKKITYSQFLDRTIPLKDVSRRVRDTFTVTGKKLQGFPVGYDKGGKVEKDNVNLKGKRFIARGCGAVMSDRRKKTLYT
tara:strand:- start:614 stop:916 length:303 start_codon:yes stop_codon:yes gene_type:complete